MKYWIRLCLCLCLLCTVSVFLWAGFHLHAATSKKKTVRGGEPPHAVDMYDEIMSEDDALKFPPTTSRDLISDATKSTMELIAATEETKVGDMIRVCITMYDHTGNRKTTGGDIIKLFMCNPSVGSTTRGTVVDNHNGTYTGEVEAAWSGQSELVAMLEYTREAISAMFRVRREMASLEKFHAVFQENNYSETTVCHPDSNTLSKHFNYTRVCNLTYENSGMPWYCGKPTNKKLLCEDWHLTFSSTGLPLRMTDVEQELLTRGKLNITRRIIIHVSPDSRGSEIIRTPMHHCLHPERRKSWNLRDPAGFVYHNTWSSSVCKLLQLEQINQVIAYKSIYFLGDSNGRAMYRYTVWGLNCTDAADAAPVKNLAWHRPTKCSNSAWNFTVQWFPHAQPFITSIVPDTKAYTTVSVARRLDTIRDDEDAVVVIHIYIHLLLYHHSVFERKMRMIRTSVASLLERNKKAQVVILGPHTFTTSAKYPDLYGYIYSHILYNVFTGLHDKVLFVNAREVTDTFFNQFSHPSYDIVNTLLRMIFSFL